MKALIVGLTLLFTILAVESPAEPIFRRAKFTGLLGENVADPTKRGLINAVTSPNRTITAKVKRKGRSLSLKAVLDANGNLSKTFKITFAGQVIASFHVELQLSEDGNSMAGTIEEGGDIQPFTLDRAIFSAADPTPLAGNFSALIPIAGGDFPTGVGFASVKITPLGAVTVSGKLADGSPFVSKTPVVVGNKIVVFSLLYKNNGGILGTVSFGGSNDQATGQLTWGRLDSAKPDKILPSAYQGSVTMNVTRYNPPDGVAALPNLGPEGNARVTLTGGNVQGTFTADVKVNAKSKVSVPAPNDAGVKVKIVPATGVVSGKAKVTLADGEKTVSFFGIISQAAADQRARGFFVGRDRAGTFTLQATP